VGRALSAYSKPIIATAEPQWRNIHLHADPVSDHTGSVAMAGADLDVLDHTTQSAMFGRAAARDKIPTFR
jgi:hypothetical protein